MEHLECIWTKCGRGAERFFFSSIINSFSWRSLHSLCATNASASHAVMDTGLGRSSEMQSAGQLGRTTHPQCPARSARRPAARRRSRRRRAHRSLRSEKGRTGASTRQPHVEGRPRLFTARGVSRRVGRAAQAALGAACWGELLHATKSRKPEGTDPKASASASASSYAAQRHCTPSCIACAFSASRAST